VTDDHKRVVKGIAAFDDCIFMKEYLGKWGGWECKVSMTSVTHLLHWYSWWWPG